MNWFQKLLSNPFLLIGLSSWFWAQLIKTIIHAIVTKSIDFTRLIGDGGMPSGHSATVCAVATSAGILYGLGSFPFAISVIVAIIVMHDAMGVRHETGEQAKVLNQMIDQWIDISEKNSPFLQNMHLKEMVGHTPLQVMAGMVVGIVVGCLYPMHLV